MPAYIIRFTPAEGGSEVPMALPESVSRTEAESVAKQTARTAFAGEARLYAGLVSWAVGGVTDTTPPLLLETFKSQRWRVAVTWPETDEVRVLRWQAFDPGEVRELSLAWAERQGIRREQLTFLDKPSLV